MHAFTQDGCKLAAVPLESHGSRCHWSHTVAVSSSGSVDHVTKCTRSHKTVVNWPMPLGHTVACRPPGSVDHVTKYAFTQDVPLESHGSRVVLRLSGPCDQMHAFTRRLYGRPVPLSHTVAVSSPGSVDHVTKCTRSHKTVVIGRPVPLESHGSRVVLPAQWTM
ncbi:hypothetical protein J6590_017360 [Homalodisca vitripennis]|nr:hypothetical protein J6590_017360 [Homalodisca vitripennis]